MKDLIETGFSRGEFLRIAACGSAGVGLAAMAGTDSHADGPAVESRNGYVVVVTHSHSDPTRVMLALFTATRLPEGDNHVWFAIDGGQICKRGEAEKVTSPLFTKQGNAAQMIDQIRKKGVALHI